MYGDQHQYKYMTVDDMKSLGDDSMRMDVTRDEKGDYRHSYGKCFCLKKITNILLKVVLFVFFFSYSTFEHQRSNDSSEFERLLPFKQLHHP